MKLSAKQRRIAAIKARPAPAPANDTSEYVSGTFTEVRLDAANWYSGAAAAAIADTLRSDFGQREAQARYQWQQVSFNNQRVSDQVLRDSTRATNSVWSGNLDERWNTPPYTPSYETVWDPASDEYVVRQVLP